MRFECIQQREGIWPVSEMCDCFEVNASSYYACRNRDPSARSQADEGYKERITTLHKKSKSRYGYRPIYHHLRDEGLECGRDRTRRLMKEINIEGLQKKSFKPLGTNSRHDFGYSPNLLKEYGMPEACNQIWVADTTYLRTVQGWSYLATVMDLCSRRIIGWSVSDHNDAALCGRALQSAVMTRGGECIKGVIHHSDRGSTYASYDYQRLLAAHGITPSMSAKGNCYDNAAMESFFGRFKIASAGDITFADLDHARSAVFEYIETFYNRFRKHSALSYKNPVEFEEKNFPLGGTQPSLSACFNQTLQPQYQS
jgi:transposase InsO family protein